MRELKRFGFEGRKLMLKRDYRLLDSMLTLNLTRLRLYLSTIEPYALVVLSKSGRS